MAQDYDFSGKWQSSYTFTTDSPDAAFTDAYDVDIRLAGNQLVIQSLPKEDGSYILIRVTLDDRILTGTWYEQTAPDGHYKGVIYYGPIQMVMDEDGNAMRGKWLGLDDKMIMQGGNQQIVRLDTK
jgi:hypothetical protein